MVLGQIFQSVGAWQKLSAISMKAALAYKILKYIKLVNEDHVIIEKQRVALIHEVTGTQDGEDVKLEPGTPEFIEYAQKFNEMMTIESDLRVLYVDFEEVVNAVDEKDESLSVLDLAMLEPFFDNSVVEEGN